MRKKKNKVSAVYLLPNLVTLGAMFCGFYSIVSAINALYIQSAIFILFAMLLDGLDGRVARLTNTQTSFGEHFDSLSDLLCFGIAPALLIYLSSLSMMTFGYLAKLSYIACFVYIASAAIRLARFNSRNQTTDKKYFVFFQTKLCHSTNVNIWGNIFGEISHVRKTSNNKAIEGEIILGWTTSY